MNIELQVCSLELSKRLKELGVKQDSLFYWDCNEEYYGHSSTNNNIITYGKNVYIPNHNHIFYSAFTVAELLDMLTPIVTIENDTPFNSFRLRFEKSFHVTNPDPENLEIKTIYIANYRCDSTAVAGEDAWLERTLTSNKVDENPANALAKMLIYLLESGLIK